MDLQVIQEGILGCLEFLVSVVGTSSERDLQTSWYPRVLFVN